MSGTGDPWDTLGTDRPPTANSPLGQSPDFWNNLANFGFGTVTAANQRIPGGFLANPNPLAATAAGYLGAEQLSAQAGRQRSELAQQQATTQGQQLQNYVGALGLPSAQAMANIRYRYLTDPNFRQQYQQQFGPQIGATEQQPQSQAAPQGGGNSYADGVAHLESGGNATATNPLWSPEQGGPLGKHQITAGTWSEFAKENPQYFQNMSPAEIAAARSNPDLSTAATNWYATKNAPVLKSNGLPVTPSNLALAHTLGGQGAAGVLKMPDDTPLSQAFQVTQPNEAPAILRQNPQYQKMTVGQLKQAYANVSPLGLPPGVLDRQIGQGSQGPQVAQAGNVATDVVPPQGIPQQQPQGGNQPQSQPGIVSNQQALATAQEYENRANQIEAARSWNEQLKGMGLPITPITGDPAALRQAAQQFRQSALSVHTGRPGSITYQGTEQAGEVPIQSDEVITSGPNIGMHVKVFRKPSTGEIVAPPQGTETTPGLPPGAVPSGLSPQQEGMLKAQPAVMTQDIEHDRGVVEGDLSHVLENVIPAKQQLFQLRGLIDQAAPGAAGQLRADFKNWIQTFAPDFVSQITGNASPAQEFNKIALMGAGKQERGDLGAKGGFRAMEMYVKANPNLDMQPTADRDMANNLLITHQFHEDYATGASNFYTKNRTAFMTPNNPQPYQPISAYDQRFIQNMRPELYASAMEAMNGKPYAEWSKGLAPRQLQIVGGILQRTDPSAMIDVNGKQINVGAFTKTVGPTDIGP